MLHPILAAIAILFGSFFGMHHQAATLPRSAQFANGVGATMPNADPFWAFETPAALRRHYADSVLFANFAALWNGCTIAAHLFA
jgi:hypothetical protein